MAQLEILTQYQDILEEVNISLKGYNENLKNELFEIEVDENLTISQKMKLLREKFDNGEITYEEYQAKRKELI